MPKKPTAQKTKKAMSKPPVLADALPTEWTDILGNNPGGLGWSFGFVFKEVHRAFSDAMTEKLKPLGITLSQWYFLRHLWDKEGVTQRELSAKLGITEPSTGGTVELLIRKGLITRRQQPGDHRSQYLYLTTTGRLLREQALDFAVGLNKVALRGFSREEAAELQRKIFRMVTNLKKRAR